MEDIVRFEPSDDNGKIVECPCPFIAELMKKSNVLGDLNNNLGDKFNDMNGWVDNQDVMLAFNISKKVLQDMRSRHKIPYTKFGSKIVYSIHDIAKMLRCNYMEVKK